ncbi:type II secretion system GspH family protein [bacterium]|nr:type II secretion system GspH family protein [bacterium]MBU1600143.1 type II secretion system GspH family protein [bacterium]MBU2461820.1 type II secretion system GspH family protein [bacterium]
MFTRQKGMTLIEVMIVVCIVGILLAILAPRVGIFIEKSKSKTTYINISNLRLAISAYRSDYEEWPSVGDPDGDGNFSEHLTETNFIPLIVPEYIREIPICLLRNALNNDDSSHVYFGGVPNNNGDATHGGWRYYAEPGTITVNSTERDCMNTLYTEY